jgi:hypothetical protein
MYEKKTYKKEIYVFDNEHSSTAVVGNMIVAILDKAK